MGQKYVYNPLTCEYDIINEGAPGVPGPRGPVGSSGPAGPPGQDGQDGEGVAEGGTTGQVLAKASDDNYDTEWVDQSSGSGLDLDSVLEAGSISDKTLTIGVIQGEQSDPDNYAKFTAEIEPAHIQLTENYPSMGNNIFASFSRFGLSFRHETTEGESRLIMDSGQGGSPYISLDSKNGWSSMITLPEGVGGVTVYLPDGVPGNNNEAETLATREWVAENGGGGGATPTLEDVLLTGNIANNYITLDDSNSALNLSPDSIQMQNLSGGTVQLDNDGLSIFNPDVTGTVVLDSNNTRLELKNANGDYTIAPQASAVSGGALEIPETISTEVIATREWVAANPVSSAGPTGNRPAAVYDGLMYFDTTLGKPIWYDGSQWVDATGTGV